VRLDFFMHSPPSEDEAIELIRMLVDRWTTRGGASFRNPMNLPQPGKTDN